MKKNDFEAAKKNGLLNLKGKHLVWVRRPNGILAQETFMGLTEAFRVKVQGTNGVRYLSPDIVFAKHDAASGRI